MTKQTLGREDAAVLQEARSVVSQALALLQQLNSRSIVLGDEASTFEVAIRDALFEVDSQPAIVDPYLDTAIGIEQSSSDGTLSAGALQATRRLGKLQRLRILKTALFGGRVLVAEDGVTRTETVLGLLDRLKKVTTGGTLEEM